MGLDQVHEQNNKVIKGAGGASALLNREVDSALLRWEVCSPELARVILEFEESLDKNESFAASYTSHHEDNCSFNNRFSSDVNRLVKSIVVNPFTKDRLTKLNNPKASAPEKVRDEIESMKTSAKEQLTSFISDRLVSAKVPISQPIKMNKFDIWVCSDRRDAPKFSPSHGELKKMNSACESRRDLAKELFQNEINNIPQSLCSISKKGIELFHGSKCGITKRFPNPTTTAPEYDACAKSSIVLEMSPIIKARAFSIQTSNLRNFEEFSLAIYNDIMKHAANYQRVDLVFDRYFEGSLKEGTRMARGEAPEYLFEGDFTELPFKMAEQFLSNSENKDKLNEYLAKKLLELHQGDQMLVVTYKNTSLVSQPSCSELDQHVPTRPCEAEEADQRLVRHALNIIANGYTNVLVRTIDTDVLILLVSYISQQQIGDGVNIHAFLINSDKFYNIRTIIDSLGPDICRALPFFYAFSGCDTVSSFYGKGKCKMFDIWLQSVNRDKLTEIFVQLGDSPVALTSNQMDVIERYVLELYGSPGMSLASARLDKFNKVKDNDLRSLPPSMDALYQHTLRACYQAGYLWRQSVKELVIPDPKDWGWEQDPVSAIIYPVLTTKQSQVTIIKFTKTCSCKTGKCKNCSCATAKLQCLSMCGCSKICQG